MSFESPISVLQNLAGEEVAIVSGSALNNGEQPGVAILAKDESGNAQFLNMNASGELKVQASVDVDLDYTTDSVTVYGSDGAALVQDAEDSYLLVRDNDAKNAINAAKSAITGSVEAFQAVFEAEDFATEATLAAFKADNRSDLQAVSGAVDVMNSNLGGKLDTLDSSVGAVETAVDSASSAISGSVVALGADIGGKLDTLNAVDFATETTLAAFKADNRSDLQAVSGAIDAFRADFGAEDFASETTLAAFKSDNRSDLQAVSGAIDAMKVELEATLTSIDGKDFATEATLGAFKIETNGNLIDLSSSLDRFTFNGSNELLVNAAVDVELNYATDSITIYGDEAVPFAQISGSGEMITVPLGSEGNSLLQAASGSIWSDVNGNGALLVGLLGSNSKNVLMSSANNILMVSGAGDFNVVATDLDIRPLTSADVVTVDNMVDVSLLATEATLSSVSGAIDGLGASVDAVKAAVEAIDAAQLGTVTVTATDLDIRDLNYLDDSVKIYGSEDAVLQQEAGTFKLLVKDESAISSIDAVEIAVGDANAAIVNALTGSSSVSGSIAALGADLGAKLDLFTFESDRLMISGSVLVSNPFDGVVTATDFDIRDLSSGTDSVSAVQSGDWIVRKHATSAAVSTANASTSDAEVLAVNANRMNATFFMDGNATCYIKLGGAASSSDFSVRIVNNGYYELPEGYTGSIHAVFSVTDAAIKLRITELSYT